MQRFIVLLFFCVTLVFSNHAFAMLSMELTQGVASAMPIAIVPFAAESTADISTIISNDLQNSGRFKVYGGQSVGTDVSLGYFRSMGADSLVTGKVESVGAGRYQVSFQLSDLFKGKDSSTQKAVVLSQKFVVSETGLRALAHHISDLIYQQLTGVRGVFSTRLAYVVVQRSAGSTRYILEVSDMDGYAPRPLLTSADPIMSPAWSPDGRQVAYVSFENSHSAIYVEDVATGARRLVSGYPGINGAPAWSPDGKKLALVLSKGGSPDIYIMDMATRHLTQVTHTWGITTEPAWAPNAKSIIFTSNQSGGPQIYQKNLITGTTARLTYDGNYNARASFTPDGNHVVMLNRESSLFNVGILDLDTGTLRVLTNSSGTDNESPAVAPNGSMVLYGTLYRGQSVLAMVATDGSVQIRLPARNGEVQDPAWSPFLS